MSATRVRRTFSVLVLLAWLPLAFAVYPIPSQKAAEIAKLAEDGVAAEQSLRAQGVSEKLLPPTTKEEYVAALTSEYWYMWLQGMIFLLLGIVAATMAYWGTKLWPWMVGLPSAVYATVLAYPMLSHSIGPDRSFNWITFVTRDAMSGGLQLKTLLPTYYLLVQPLLHISIVIVCLWVWRQASLHAKVA